MLLHVGIDHANNAACTTLLDSGAAVNVMAEHVFNKFITKPLTPTTIQLNSVSNQAITCKGMAIVSSICGSTQRRLPLSCHTDNKESAHDVILGRTWMHKHRCQFDWEECTINLAFGTMKITLPAVAEATVTTAIPCADLVATALPTIDRKQSCTKPRVNNGFVTTNAAIQKWWLPKKLLQAQHFYEGKGLIWVPKAKGNLDGTASVLARFTATSIK